MLPIEYLKNKVSAILKPSSIEGIGFFAVRDIEIGERIFEPWTGESGIYSITQDELHTLPEPLYKNIYETFDNKMFYQDKEGNDCQIDKEYGKLFFPLEKGLHWIYVWPRMFINSGLNRANVDTNELPGTVIKRIRQGEELLGNYGSQFKTLPKNFI